MAFAVGRRGPAPTIHLAGADHADWMHPVAAVEDEVEVARAAIDAIQRAESNWGAVVIANVDAEAPWTLATPMDRRGRPLRRRLRSSTVLPYARLDGVDYDAYLRSRSPSFRKQLLRFDRRLERQAAIELRQTATPAEFEADLETMFRLHFSHWDARGGSSLDLPGLRALHHDFARAALERGWLRLFTLEADGEPVASLYGWRLGDRFSYYQGGFDPAWSRFDVGLVTLGRVIERAIAEEAREFDMLLGSEPYKFRFCGSVRRAETLVLTKRLHPVGAGVAVELAARRAVRALPDDLRDRARRRLAAGGRVLARHRPGAGGRD